MNATNDWLGDDGRREPEVLIATPIAYTKASGKPPEAFCRVDMIEACRSWLSLFPQQIKGRCRNEWSKRVAPVSMDLTCKAAGANFPRSEKYNVDLILAALSRKNMSTL